MNQLLQQPFFQVTLPIVVTLVVTIWLASWSQNKRFDDIHCRLDEIIKRLERIETKLTPLNAVRKFVAH
jgi:hypothetical protein